MDGLNGSSSMDDLSPSFGVNIRDTQQTGRKTEWKSKTARSDKESTFQHISLHSFRVALRASNVRGAWIMYKRLMQSDHAHRIGADEHSTVLSLLPKLTIPSLAQAHSKTVVYHMRQEGIRLDIRDYHILLHINLMVGDRPAMERLMLQMTDIDDVTPDVKCYNLMMAINVRLGDLQSLEKVWVDLLQIIPASRLLNHDGWALLVEGYGTAGVLHKAQTAYMMYLDTINHRNSPFHLDALTNEVSADPVVLEALIRAHGLNKSLQKAKTLFEERRNSHPVDEHAFDSIIEACEVNSDLKSANLYWESLLCYCESLKVGTDTSLMDEVTIRGSEVYRGKHRPPHPLPITIARLVRLNARLGRKDDAIRIFTHFDKIVVQTADSFEDIVWLFIKDRKYNEAQQVVKLMVKRGYSVPTAVLNKLNTENNL